MHSFISIQFLSFWNFPSSFDKMQHTLKCKHNPCCKSEGSTSLLTNIHIPLMRSRLSRLIQNVIKIMGIWNIRVALILAEMQTIWNIDGANTERYCDYVQSGRTLISESQFNLLLLVLLLKGYLREQKKKYPEKMATIFGMARTSNVGNPHTCEPKIRMNFSNWLSFSRLFSLQWNTSFICFFLLHVFDILLFHFIRSLVCSFIRHLWLEQ